MAAVPNNAALAPLGTSENRFGGRFEQGKSYGVVEKLQVAETIAGLVQP